MGSGLFAEDAPAVELSAVEFDVLGERLGVEEFPVVLRVPSPGRSTAERAALVRAAWDGLARRGLADHPEIDPGLAGMLAVLARPESAVDVRVWGGRETRALAALAGGTAVLAVLTEGALRLREIDGGLARHAVSVAPPVPAGSGRSVTLPTADLAAAAPAGDLAAALAARGVRGDDARGLGEMIGPLAARGQFGCAHRDRYGRRRRTGRTVSFFDTADGRYVQLVSVNADGVSWTTIAPADRRAMLAHVEELVKEV
ncbi:ESX secretion-associated protein EspG [Actinokineospora guangxiensis]|uniref:ESX secretion-associated protein EspG n=1 Tax=Actinokineospora guangxiensis TaxID=1490288 RepID=A0ABW0ESN9_9PSEU